MFVFRIALKGEYDNSSPGEEVRWESGAGTLR